MPTGYQIYKQDAAYFLTFQVVKWIDVFTRKTYRDILCESLNYCTAHKGFQIFAYVIMSNHCHLLVRAEKENLSSVIHDFKRFTAVKILSAIQNNPESRREWMLALMKEAANGHAKNEHYQFWTHENHAEEIYSPEFTLQKIRYIHDNPVRAGIVERPEHYLYSSARDYTEQKGPVKIIRLDLHMMMSGKDSWKIK